MFGYVRYDLPNLHIKDFMLYKAMYCGLCKGIGAACGQRARLGLTYDVTFLSALLHNMTGQDVKITQQNCFEHAIRKRPIAEADALTQELGALNALLTYYKLADDIADGSGGRVRQAWFKKGAKRAKARYPEMSALVEQYVADQAAVEKKRSPSPDEAAEPTAALMRALAVHFLGEKNSPAAEQLFYAVGKWVYLIDALDDYEKDLKKGRYNPFVLAYGRDSREKLLKENGQDLAFLFDTLFYDLREGLAGVKFYFNRDLTDNVILRGIPLETRRVLSGEPRKEMQVSIK